MKYTQNIPEIYAAWERMIDRCYNPKNQKYKFYGAIGVAVCDEWRNNYQGFLDWSLANGWQKGLQIDKDIKGNSFLYSPENCSWVTPKQNQRARKHLVRVNYKGKDVILVDLCNEHGIECRIVKQRLNRDGMTLHQALTTPNTGQGNHITRKKENSQILADNA